jgi:aryl-alcohol dehydrogenase-like predicted oxidoreductase
VEDDVPTCRALSIGSWRTVIGRGFLTGRFTSPSDLAEGIGVASSRVQEENFNRNLQIVAQELAARKNAPCLALAWVLAQARTSRPYLAKTPLRRGERWRRTSRDPRDLRS